MIRSELGLKWLLALGVAFSLHACTKSHNEILVGEYGSLTGSTATFGLSTNKGIKMALDEVNEKGGVKGKKIKLITLDNQGKSEEAAAAVTRLITQNKVVAILGEVASSLTMAAAPIAQQHKIPLITPSSTNPKVTQIGDFVFRICYIDPFQGYVMAKFATENLKVKKVAVFRDKSSAYSVGLADAFIESFQKMGGSIILDTEYEAGNIDFKAQLTQMKGKGPEAIFIPGYYTEVGLIARQAQQMGLKVPLLGGDGWDSSKLNEIGKAAINGHYFANHYSTESTDPAVQDFIKKFQAKYNEVPDGLAALGYDAAKILVAAMERTTEITPQTIRDEIAKTKDFPGVTGKISINENRDAVKPAVVVQVEDDKRKFVTSVTPL